jgi:hypothetical protein
MQKRTCYFTLIAMAMTVAILACNLPGATTIPENTPVIPPNTSGTSVALTVQAELAKAIPPQLTTTPTVAVAVASPTPTSTNPPLTNTQQPPTATLTQLPCNQVSFVSDVSVPDGSVFETGKSFTKTWRLKNTGSCTWTSGYQLVFVNGDQMNGPGSQSLTGGTVAPGGTVEVSVNLVAPASAGTYKGYWKIRDPSGITFGLSTGSFWVEIRAEEPIPEHPASLPDLYVSEFTITPATPIVGQIAHVRIGVYNQGNAVASQFTVLWYGLSTFANPSCSWDVMDIIPPNGGKILQCDFVFQSPYPLNKTSLVIVDSANHVAESNEGNNQGTISPFGVANP